ncbi:uncharacterized protein J3D65DRAFT_276081 [Phyllosticta citribraziliensis]|uniref:Uncharacterized protein n=1 Tax=Phyllosticta citribraziliensis TaxID=989973 RepID=A0ABR1LVW8_9PEZI
METVASLEFERAAAHHVAAASPPPPLPPVSVRPAVSLAARAPSVSSPHHPATYKTIAGTSHPSASQESQLSASSTTSAAPRLLSSQSNVSTDSIPETESTSPATSNVSTQIDPSKPVVATLGASAPVQRPGALDTCITPRKQTTLQHDSSPRSAAGSPMAIDTPPTSRGAKRTASGLIKPPTSAYGGTETGASSAAHSRNTSTESGLSRIGKLSAELKTRLSYAMIKVQNGWEQKSFDELETVASQRNSPAVQTPTFARTIASPRGADSRRQSAHSAPEAYAASPGHGSPLNNISRSYSASFPNSASRNDKTRPTTSSSNDSSTPSLAPSVDISPKRHRRSTSNRPPPKLGTSQQRPQPHPAAYPTTPTGKFQGPSRAHQRNHSHSPYPQPNQTHTPTPRQGQLQPRPAGILRMPSQQAEMDAVDSLLFMSSPNNSAHFAQQQNLGGMSALRPEAAGGSAVKRVAFDEARRGRGSGYGAVEGEAYGKAGAGVDVDMAMEMEPGDDVKVNGSKRSQEITGRDGQQNERADAKAERRREEEEVAKDWASVVGSATADKKGSAIPAQPTAHTPVPAPLQVNGRADSASASSG